MRLPPRSVKATDPFAMCRVHRLAAFALPLLLLMLLARPVAAFADDALDHVASGRLLDVGLAWHCHADEGHPLDSCVGCTAALVRDYRSPDGLTLLAHPRCVGTTQRSLWNVTFGDVDLVVTSAGGSGRFRVESRHAPARAKLRFLGPHSAQLAMVDDAAAHGASTDASVPLRLDLDGASARPPAHVVVGHGLLRQGREQTLWRQQHCAAVDVAYASELRAAVEVPYGCRVAAVGAALVATSDGRVKALLEPSGPVVALPGDGSAIGARSWTGVRIGELHSPADETVREHAYDEPNDVRVYLPVSPIPPPGFASMELPPLRAPRRQRTPQ